MCEKKYNVLYISNESALGGAAQSLLDMIKNISSKNVNPIVIIPQKGIIEERLLDLEISYYVVNFTNGLGRIGLTAEENEDKNFYDNYLAAIQLQKIIRQENIHLVHINSSVSNVGAFAAIMAGIPYVWHFRELLEEDFDSEFWDKKLKKKLMQYADTIITISECVQESYKNKYGIDSKCIYDGLDIEKYKKDVTKACFTNEQNNFIITGNITENKGQWDAIRAVKILVDEGLCNIHLTLIGNSSPRFLWTLNKYILNYGLGQYIKILPFQQDLSQYRADSQYALTTSKMEALGRCTIEGMLAGNVIIGANTGGTLELIGEQENRGYLYEQGNYINLAQVMKKVILDSNDKKKDYLQVAQNYAVDTFDADKYADAIIDVYKHVCDNHGVNECDRQVCFRDLLKVRYDSLLRKGIGEEKCGEKKNRTKSIQRKFENLQGKWTRLIDSEYRLKQYFANKKVDNIAIYGMGYWGCKLYDEIMSSGIKIQYVVDRDPQYISEVVDVRKPEEELTDIGMLIITVLSEEEELVEHYKRKFDFPVVGLSEMIEALSNP